jgi:hypothetical protein
MCKQSLAAAVVLAATTISAPWISAQSTTAIPPKPIATCSSGLSGGGPNCPLDRRLLIDVRRHGEGAPPELYEVVDMGASAAGVFRITPEQATTGDSALYAIVDVTRDASGQYTIEESIAGSLLTGRSSCRGSSTGKLDDLAFGAYLATVTARLVRCAKRDRPQIGKQ